MCHPVNEFYSHDAEQQIELPGSEQPLPTYAYGYTAGESKAAVIILHDIYGAGPFYRDLARRLAEQGYAALLPDLFYRQGPIAERTRELAFERVKKHSFPTALADIQALVAYLRAEGRRVGVIGFCMGGTLSLFVAARIPEVQACVVYYGFPVNAQPTAKRPDSPIDEAAQLQVPLLGFFGANDEGVGVENVQAYEEIARKAGKNIDFLMYPDVGHAFLTFANKGTAVPASQDSWRRTLAFFAQHLS